MDPRWKVEDAKFAQEGIQHPEARRFVVCASSTIEFDDHGVHLGGKIYDLSGGHDISIGGYSHGLREIVAAGIRPIQEVTPEHFTRFTRELDDGEGTPVRGRIGGGPAGAEGVACGIGGHGIGSSMTRYGIVE